MRARDAHGSPLVKAFYDIHRTLKWGTLDGLGIDLIADMYPHCAEMIGLRGQLPIQIKSSAGRIEDFIAQKKEVDRRFRLMDPYRLRVMCLNGSLPPDKLRLQCALGIIDYVGLEHDPGDFEVNDLLRTFFHPVVVESTLERMRQTANQPYAGTVVEFPVREYQFSTS